MCWAWTTGGPHNVDAPKVSIRFRGRPGRPAYDISMYLIEAGRAAPCHEVTEAAKVHRWPSPSHRRLTTVGLPLPKNGRGV